MAADPPIKNVPLDQIWIGTDEDHGLYVFKGDGFIGTTEAGGWKEVIIPRGNPIIEFGGRGSQTRTVPIMLDGFAENRDIEPKQIMLDNFRKIIIYDPKHPKPQQPQPIYFRGKGIGALGDNNPWMLQDIAYNDIDRRADGQPIRMMITLTVIFWPGSDTLSFVKSKKPSHPTRGKPYKVRKGDTLHKIAAKRLGSSKRWDEIADLNHLRDGKALRVGSTLKMPAK